MIELPIYDSLFAHDPSKINSVEVSKQRKWKRRLDEKDELVFLSDMNLDRVDFVI